MSHLRRSLARQDLADIPAFHRIAATSALNPKYKTHFRMAEPDDAEFIFSLRADDELSRHLNKGADDVVAQRQWLERYKERERDGLEFYFVIAHDRVPHGVVRMYDFREIDGRSSFCWGSWIIPPPKVSGLATVSAVMVYELGFDALGFEACHFDVRQFNGSVLAFHLRAGATFTHQEGEDLHFRFTPENALAFRLRSQRQVAEHRIPI
ncbi:GNAT family N-acetyltransferase [Bradyrhizobium sp.]|uniref:GNAT family N-acetyltransferase n=1 Tax=Bradyrhizobium sp. TaxID=376 RepID=UPI0039E3EDC6